MRCLNLCCLILAVFCLPGCTCSQKDALQVPGPQEPATPAGDGGQRQPLIESVREGDLDAVRTFIAAGVDVNATNNEGKTALMIAREKGKPEIIHLLEETEASKRQK